MRILISSGPTVEPIDQVRFLSNRSSGRMGCAVAAAAAQLGHDVVVVSGPVHVDYPGKSRVRRIQTAREMHAAMLEELGAADMIIMVAAVADYRPRAAAPGKLARKDGLVLELEPTEDILADVSRKRRAGQTIVGFALEESGNLERAKEKLVRKGLDWVVYNPLKTMDSPEIEARLLGKGGEDLPFGPGSKADFAAFLLKTVVACRQPTR